MFFPHVVVTLLVGMQASKGKQAKEAKKGGHEKHIVTNQKRPTK
jgi:hypothetical protein